MKQHGHGQGLNQSIKKELSVICVHLLAFAYIILCFINFCNNSMMKKGSQSKIASKLPISFHQ